MSKPSKTVKSAKVARRAGAVAIAATLAYTAAPQAFAFGDPNLKPHIDHLITCIGLLISDPDAHAANCLPNRVPEVIYTEDNDSDDFVPAPPPPPPSVVVPTPTPPTPSGCGSPT